MTTTGVMSFLSESEQQVHAPTVTLDWGDIVEDWADTQQELDVSVPDWAVLAPQEDAATVTLDWDDRVEDWADTMPGEDVSVPVWAVIKPKEDQTPSPAVADQSLSANPLTTIKKGWTASQELMFQDPAILMVGQELRPYKDLKDQDPAIMMVVQGLSEKDIQDQDPAIMSVGHGIPMYEDIRHQDPAIMMAGQGFTVVQEMKFSDPCIIDIGQTFAVSIKLIVNDPADGPVLAEEPPVSTESCIEEVQETSEDNLEVPPPVTSTHMVSKLSTNISVAEEPMEEQITSEEDPLSVSDSEIPAEDLEDPRSSLDEDLPAATDLDMPRQWLPSEVESTEQTLLTDAPAETESDQEDRTRRRSVIRRMLSSCRRRIARVARAIRGGCAAACCCRSSAM